MGSEANLDQPFRRRMAVALSHLVNHGLPLSPVATGGHHGDSHDHLRVGGEFDSVEGQALAAIGHLHHCGLAVA